MANRKAKNEKLDPDAPDEYDRDLERDNRRQAEGLVELEPQGGVEREPLGTDRPMVEPPRGEYAQKDRKGQAQSPAELTPNQPPKQKEGHS